MEMFLENFGDYKYSFSEFYGEYLEYSEKLKNATIIPIENEWNCFYIEDDFINRLTESHDLGENDHVLLNKILNRTSTDNFHTYPKPSR
eukprot:Pgem_evm1s10787